MKALKLLREIKQNPSKHYGACDMCDIHNPDEVELEQAIQQLEKLERLLVDNIIFGEVIK